MVTQNLVSIVKQPVEAPHGTLRSSRFTRFNGRGFAKTARSLIDAVKAKERSVP